jgi:hypothetical protein
VSTDDDRLAFIAGEDGRALSPEERNELEGLRDLLADPAMWAEPGPDLEDRIVASISAEAATRAGPTAAPKRWSRSRQRVSYALGGVAAAVAVVVVLALTVLSGGSAALQYAGALVPAGPVPQSSGDVTLAQTRAGWRIELRASGLPRLDNGRYYEAWMVNAAGARVPVGSFNQGPEVTLWSGVSPAAFPTITVTAQDVASGPPGSGPRVLVGHVSEKR